MESPSLSLSKNEQVKLKVIDDFREGKLSRTEAASALQVSPRTVSRLATRVRGKGPSGIKHGNAGRTPKNKSPDERKAYVLDLVSRLYFDFSLAHAQEMLQLHHELKVSYATLHGWCRAAGLGKRQRRRPSKARLRRERMANEGVLLQMDGSHHAWNGKDEWCLVSLIDDATSEVVFARFFDGETTWACMRALRGVIEAKGLPCYLYTDEAGWAGGSTKRPQFSQFVRACEELGIGVITTRSPESKGRIERSYRTFQGRLIPEMRLYGVHSMLDANRYLEQCFLPAWRERFSVEARALESRYRTLPAHVDLDQVFCMKYGRQVAKDHVILFEGERYRLTPRHLGSLWRKEVSVHRSEAGDLRFFLGHLEIDAEKVTLPKRRWKGVG